MCVNICVYIGMYVYVYIFRLIFCSFGTLCDTVSGKIVSGNTYNISPSTKHSPWIAHSINWQWSRDLT